MFAFESAAFIQTMFLNMKSVILKRTEKKLNSMLSKMESRERSQSAPSITPMKPKLQRSDSNTSLSSNSSSSCASPSPTRRHRRKKSRVVQDLNPFWDEVGTTDASGRVINSQKKSRSCSKRKEEKRRQQQQQHRRDKSFNYYSASISDGNRSDGSNGNANVCSFFSLCEASIKKWFPRLNNPKQQECLIFDDKSLSKFLELEGQGGKFDNPSSNERDTSAAYNPSAKEVLRNAESISVYLMTVSDQEEVNEDDFIAQRRCHRRSSSFSMSDSEDDSTTVYSSIVY
mmetsp:Transcript_8432/g.12490  ORF Transcript_8432/g.12490 Transcript_8432/m.12490 type:complete len:286 (+) Transcript_8432:287-1144(+)